MTVTLRKTLFAIAWTDFEDDDDAIRPRMGDLKQMKTHFDCMACFVGQALRAGRHAGADDATLDRIMRRTLNALEKSDWGLTPIEISRDVYRVVRTETGVDDPFARDRHEANLAVLGRFDNLRRRVQESRDPVRTALLLAVAGNIIDLGVLVSYDIDRTIEKVLTTAPAIDHIERLKGDIEKARTLLFFADNSGEIVFDRLLLETILAWRPIEVKVIVKSGPQVNDAQIEDARMAGIFDLGVEVAELSNGDEGPAPDMHSDEVAGWIAGADVVLSKGQANYEAFSQHKKIYFALMTKCILIAKDIGVPMGSTVVGQM